MTSGERLAILGPAPPDRGGIAQLTARLAEELARTGPVSYYTYSRPYPVWLDPRKSTAFDPGAPSPATPILDWRSPGSWRRAAEAIAGSRAQALIVPWWTAFWSLPTRAVFRQLERTRPRPARLLLVHNVEDHESGALQRFLGLGAFLSADGFFVHSDWARRSLERLVPGRPIGVAPLAVHEAPPIDRETARRRLGIGTRPLALFVGLIRPYKGLGLLIDAAPAIVRESGAQIAIVGESFRGAEDFERRWRDSPVAGDILRRDAYLRPEEIDEWLAACDVLVLPYLKIAGSAIAARALAARCPMAASRVGSLAEAVQAGVTGELFEPGDAAGLVSAVRTVLGRGRSHYEAGLSAAARNASWENYARKIRDFAARLASAP
ncbi:MAG TPA: glycosyltransferase [Thermoanaerobaculia bacterium]|nr:glycosyltransferase [Thermoanaerobaculia bacterium]